MLNLTAFIGRFTADPQLQKTANGLSFVRFRVAVDREKKRDDGTRPADFISCIAWNQTAEFICKYFLRGSMATIKGRLESSSWKDKDGKARYEMLVRTEEIWFGESKTAREERENRMTAPTPPAAPAQNYPEVDEAVPFEFSNGN